MLEQIDHVNIVVKDLEAMTRFYRDRLGLKVTKQVTISGEWIDSVVGLSGARADVVYLDPSSGPRVELIKYRSPDGPSFDAAGISNAKGLRHIAFKVDNIDRTALALQRGGVKLLSDVREVPSEQVTYAAGMRKRLVYFHDPEGNLLELSEYRAASGGAPVVPPARRRRMARSRRRLLRAVIVVALIAGATIAALRFVAPEPVSLVAATTTTVQKTDWMDPDNPEIIGYRDAYRKTEGPARRGRAFEKYAAQLHYVASLGRKLSQEDILGRLGAPDIYRDLGPFRYFSYAYSENNKNDLLVDIDFDKSGFVHGFTWKVAAEADHAAISWKPFPTTRSTDGHVLYQLLPQENDVLPLPLER